MTTTKILEFKLRSVGLSEFESFVRVYSFTFVWILNLELAVVPLMLMVANSASATRSTFGLFGDPE